MLTLLLKEKKNMPVPFLLAAAAAIGLPGTYGVKKILDAKETMKNAQNIVECSQNTVKEESEKGSCA